MMFLVWTTDKYFVLVSTTVSEHAVGFFELWAGLITPPYFKAEDKMRNRAVSKPRLSAWNRAVSGLRLNAWSGEGSAKLPKWFEKYPPLWRMDILKDWIYDLEEEYERSRKDFRKSPR